MAEIEWTEETQMWLKDIFDFIANDNPSVAANVVEDIYERAQVLRDFPRIGHRYELVDDREVRILLYGH